RMKWWTEFAGLDGAAMNFLADAGVVNVGTEAFSIDNPAATLPDADPPYPAHQVCRDRKVLNTENLIIPRELIGRRFTYIGFPIKIVGGTGGWIRAVAVLDERELQRPNGLVVGRRFTEAPIEVGDELRQVDLRGRDGANLAQAQLADQAILQPTVAPLASWLAASVRRDVTDDEPLEHPAHMRRCLRAGELL